LLLAILSIKSAILRKKAAAKYNASAEAAYIGHSDKTVA
jgi:hypothetical protein